VKNLPIVLDDGRKLPNCLTSAYSDQRDIKSSDSYADGLNTDFWFCLTAMGSHKIPRVTDSRDPFLETVQRIRRFRDERDWMQFHNPQNLAASIVIEAAELLEHFQWKDPDQSEAHAKSARDAVGEEIADVAVYLIELADNLGIDLWQAISRKMDLNEQKYPVDKARGTAKKYHELK
jgi:NTP pyrophosphatase (non-canonical NTP hydrolase)